MSQVLKIHALVGLTSGEYQMQAKGNNLADWTAIDAGDENIQNGQFDYPDLTIAADVLIPGNAYLIRMIDTTTSLSSNTVRVVIP